MKIIIPMAGKGTRLHPHTLNTPKPLIPIVGKTILKRLINNLYKVIKIFSIQEIIFIIGNFENDIKKELIKSTNDIGINPIFYYQKNPQGTADALLKAKNSLIGPIIIAFSDTLFYHTSIEKEITNKVDNIIWTKKVKKPHLFGVVKCDSSGLITNFIEKPKYYVSNLAIVGLYYLKNGHHLRDELQYILDKKIKNEEEYQLTSALERMRKKGEKFTNKKIKEWMDFGNKKRTLSSNSKILSIESKNSKLIHKNTVIKNSFIIKPCYIEENTNIENSIIGPYVSIGKYTKIKNSNIKKSLILNYTIIENANLYNSMIGNFTSYTKKAKEVSLGDYSNFN
ncbi:sugar phosphate nucleotidyltransferase [Blattabacterium cuenoti]|uniref:sugar phosphate nucleotidyltransferase n=1 Tax=Blattabacterium cuenoti TaxID=1653831 RepID=UPI00163C9191|nr:sugar phosphate nucleotidyltransferase [Blattabacterium cuenoti]